MRGTDVLVRFLADDDGATSIEYVLIAALIAVAMIAGVTLVGDSLVSLFGDIATDVDAAGA